MKIKIESGAKVQITDKPIINNIVYGDVVQNHVLPIQNQEKTTKMERKYTVQDVLLLLNDGVEVCWSEVTSNYRDISFMEQLLGALSSSEFAEKVMSEIIKSMEIDIDLVLRKKLGDTYSDKWKTDSELAGPIWDLSDALREVLVNKFSFQKEKKEEKKSGFSSAIIDMTIAEDIVSQLHNLLKGKTKPKDIVMPIRAAIDAGVIRRPTWEEFRSEFGTVSVSKSSYNDYTDTTKPKYYGDAYNSIVISFQKMKEKMV